VEIVDLLRMKEISTIHKVKLGENLLTVSEFIDQYEKGELPEQNLEKAFEDDPEEEVRKWLKNPKFLSLNLKPEPEPKIIEVPEPGPATEIHVNRSGTQFGPYLLKELKDYLKAGNLRFSDLVWFEGVAEWVPLSRIPGVAEGLSSLGSAAPPPPKPPPAPTTPAGPPPMHTMSAPPPSSPTSLLKKSNTVEEKDEKMRLTKKKVSSMKRKSQILKHRILHLVVPV
jgi:hypothetical protein